MDRGFLEVRYLLNGAEKSKISQCPECKDVSKYSAEIKKRYGDTETPQQRADRILGRS